MFVRSLFPCFIFIFFPVHFCMLTDLSQTACGIQLTQKCYVAYNDSCSGVWLGVECKERWSSTVSTNDLGLFDLLLKVHFLFVLQPVVVNNHTGVGLQTVCLLMCCISQLHTIQSCVLLSLSSIVGCWLLCCCCQSLKQWCNICLEITMPPAFFLE